MALKKKTTATKPTACPPVGAHMSIAGGMPNAVERACRVESTALQVFTKNASRWRDRALRPGEAEAFRAAVAEACLPPPVSHASYLINLASPKPELAEQSFDAMRDELERADALGIAGVVLHPGAHMGDGEAAALARVAAAFNRLFDAMPEGRAAVYIEGTAGQGTCLGHRFEHLAEIIAAVENKARIAVCLDTCHMFAAGYGLTTAEEVAATLDEFDRVVGMQWLRVMHTNDSKHPLGSRRDRHEHIGQGTIGEAGFAALLRDPRLAAIPFILETPKGDDLAEDRVNLATLRRLAAGEL